MASYVIMHAAPQFGSALLRCFSRLLPGRGPVPDADRDDSRARRDFLMDMLDRNPDAFASEHDVQSMIRLYPGHF